MKEFSDQKEAFVRLQQLINDEKVSFSSSSSSSCSLFLKNLAKRACERVTLGKINTSSLLVSLAASASHRNYGTELEAVSKEVEDILAVILIETARLDLRKNDLKEELDLFSKVPHPIDVGFGRVTSSGVSRINDENGEEIVETIIDTIFPFVEDVQKILKVEGGSTGNGGLRGGGMKSSLKSWEVKVDAIVAERNSNEYRVKFENRWNLRKEEGASELKFVCNEEEHNSLSNALKDALRAALS